MEEKLAFEKHIAAIDKARPHDLRNSHRFELRRTRGNIIPRDSQALRQSLKVRHKDLHLDAHTKHIAKVMK